MKLTGAQIIIKLLEMHGIDVIAGIPGGANLPLYDALHKSKIRHILTRHEQGAGFIAQGIARTTGKPAVCFATSGPGATNIITAIADAKLDSIPIITITGQVPSSLIGTDAFQEVDTYGITIPITKHNFLVRSASELLTVIPEAFRIAGSGRPGPVVVDVPKNVQTESIEFDSWPDINYTETIRQPELPEISRIAGMIKDSKRPVLYIGGGITNSQAEELLIRFAEKNSIPVTSTLMGLGCFPADNPLYIGMIGMHGARYTNFILDKADLLLAFGTRFDDRATGKVSKFCPHAKIVHVDIDQAEINKIKKTHISISADIKDVLASLIPLTEQNSRTDWINEINALRESHPFMMPGNSDPLHPLNIIKYISELLDSQSIVTTDVGQHQMWTAQGYPFRKPRTLLTSGGLGTMGFGLPAAIGAALANPGKRVVCVSGDGSILMNIQELATLADLNLDVTVVIFNNGHLGLVRQQQEFFYERNYIASRFETNPDFVAISKGFGVNAYNIDSESDPVEVLSKAISQSGPSLVNVPIRHGENVVPMVPPGAANFEMIGGVKHE